MLGTKSLIEIRQEISERLKAAGIDEKELDDWLRKMRPAKRKKPLNVKSLLESVESPKPKKRRPVATKSRKPTALGTVIPKGKRRVLATQK